MMMLAYGWTLPEVMDLTMPQIKWLFSAMAKQPPIGLMGLALKSSNTGDPVKNMQSAGIKVRTDPKIGTMLSRIIKGKKWP